MLPHLAARRISARPAADTPRSSGRTGNFPKDWIASVWKQTRRARQIAASSSIG